MRAIFTPSCLSRGPAVAEQGVSAASNGSVRDWAKAKAAFTCASAKRLRCRATSSGTTGLRQLPYARPEHLRRARARGYGFRHPCGMEAMTQQPCSAVLLRWA